MIRLFIILFLLPGFLYAEVKLPSLIGNNMVLQQNTEIKLWGKAKANSKLKITLGWNNENIVAKTDNTGCWSLMVETPKAGGPYDICFYDGDSLKLTNIYLGEVWLCSGQSNMQMRMKGNVAQPVLESNRYILDADENVPIMMFEVNKKASVEVLDNIDGVWQTNSSENVANFSAAAYFFGLELYKKLRVPVGLINASWGASNIESWMPVDTLKLYKDVSLKHLYSGEISKAPQQKGALLYNGMLNPIKDYKIKGVIWYQGEANILNYESYSKKMCSFVGHLRSMFDNSELPFYFTQIAPYGYKKAFYGALLREAQLKAEKMISNSGMAVTLDVGEEECIHPSNKKVVGERLALQALSKTYGVGGICASSPSYREMKIQDNKVILFFDNASMGFSSFGKELKNFEISDKSGKFLPAVAQIKNNTVIVWNDSIKNPVFVRYGFKNFVQGDLFGTSGLPVSSFRTDTMKLPFAE